MKKNIYEAAYIDMLKNSLRKGDEAEIEKIQDNIDITEPNPIKFDSTEVTDHTNNINEILIGIEQDLLAWQKHYNDTKKVEIMGYDPENVKKELIDIQVSLDAITKIKQDISDINNQIAVIEDSVYPM